MVRDFGKAGQFLPPLPLDPPPSSTLDSEISAVVYISIYKIGCNIYIYIYVCVCVCVREREREREKMCLFKGHNFLYWIYIKSTF